MPGGNAETIYLKCNINNIHMEFDKDPPLCLLCCFVINSWIDMTESITYSTHITAMSCTRCHYTCQIGWNGVVVNVDLESIIYCLKFIMKSHPLKQFQYA